MRTGARVSPSWPGLRPEAGYVEADCSWCSRQITCNGAGHTFLKLSPCAIRNFDRFDGSIFTPFAASNSAASSGMVMSCCLSTMARMNSRCGFSLPCRYPPRARGSTLPVSFQSFSTLTALDAAVLKRAAASRREEPSSTHSTKRQRRSFDKGLGMAVTSANLELLSNRFGKITRFNLTARCSKPNVRVALLLRWRRSVL